MIHGIGTDIVAVARLARSLDRFGDELAHRILHPDEFPSFRSAAHPSRLLAKRFAAKEAAVKALGTGFTGGIRLADVAVDHHPGGQPRLVLRGEAAVRAGAFGVTAHHLSLSDEQDHAVAFVVMEVGNPLAGASA
ncbi:MAG: holo-ACP synthase [Thiohalospira sp.]